MDDPKSVTAYDLKGFKKHLPNLVNGRYFHGCSHFSNNYEQLVCEFLAPTGALAVLILDLCVSVCQNVACSFLSLHALQLPELS